MFNVIAKIRRGLSHRAIALALLAIQVIFLNAIVPGHTRGSITMGHTPGRAPSCCCTSPPAPSTGNHPPTEDDRQHCAICFFAAYLSMPDAIVLEPPKLGLLELVLVERPAIVISSEFLPTYLACGPPPTIGLTSSI